MKPSRAPIERFLDKLSFGPYIINENDCDVQTEKARDAIRLSYPEWEHGQHIMFGLFIPQGIIVGHGILAVKCREGKLYYDCTTESGEDSSRFRTIGWMKAWLHYFKVGFVIFWWYTEWGEYTPSARFKRRRKMTPWWLYGRLFDKVRRLPPRP